jgi:hypothetical protein
MTTYKKHRPKWPDNSSPVGLVFGRLTVVGVSHDGNFQMWECLCSCGKKKAIRRASLRNGNSKSCGCANTEATTNRNYSHRESKNPVYQTYAKMIQRCENRKCKNYVDYGGRGIRVCEEWRKDFLSFLAYIGPRPSNLHTVDRIDNNGNYEPGNVKWSTRREQNRNKRNNVVVEIDGKPILLIDAAERYGIPYGTVASRLRYGWTVDRALGRTR